MSKKLAGKPGGWNSELFSYVTATIHLFSWFFIAQEDEPPGVSFDYQRFSTTTAVVYVCVINLHNE